MFGFVGSVIHSSPLLVRVKLTAIDRWLTSVTCVGLSGRISRRYWMLAGSDTLMR